MEGAVTTTQSADFYLDETVILTFMHSCTGTLHRIAAPEYFILQTDDGSVATVHQSQLTKVNSGLPSGHSYNRVKLTNEDKKNFVDDVKFYLTYVAFTTGGQIALFAFAACRPILTECSCCVYFLPFYVSCTVEARDIFEGKSLPPEDWKRQTLSRLP